MSQVLFATDLSESSRDAENLIASIPWPAETEIRVLTVVPWLADLGAAPWAPLGPVNTDALERTQLKVAEHGVRDVVARLQAGGHNASCLVTRGRASDAIVDLAESEHVDLIVVGSRGRTAIEGALVGSVAEAVTDRAPCPVLVARTSAIRRSLIALDATPGANVALDYVRARTHLLGSASDVVLVIDEGNLWAETFDMPIDAHSVQVLADDQAEVQAETRTAVAAAAARLRDAGHSTVVDVRAGLPGPEVVDAAAACDADLVVVGSRHRTGLTRLIMGSVGRHVLHHSHCSVLIVGRVPARTKATAPAPDPVSAAPDPVSAASATS